MFWSRNSSSWHLRSRERWKGRSPPSCPQTSWRSQAGLLLAPSFHPLIAVLHPSEMAFLWGGCKDWIKPMSSIQWPAEESSVITVWILFKQLFTETLSITLISFCIGLFYHEEIVLENRGEVWLSLTPSSSSLHTTSQHFFLCIFFCHKS